MDRKEYDGWKRAMMRDAALHWSTIARDYPDHALAFIAGRSAEVALNNVIVERLAAKQEITSDLPQYGQALTTLLTHCGDRPEAAGWRDKLNWVRFELAGDQVTPEALQNIVAAIDSYENTPKESKRHMEYCFEALSARFKLQMKKQQWLAVLERCPDKRQKESLERELESKTDERYLLDKLSAYAEDAASLFDKTTDEDLRKTLSSTGGWAAIRAAEMLYEKGRRELSAAVKDQAIRQAQEIQKRWTGSPYAAEAEVLEILWRFESGDVRGVEKLMKVLAERPKEADRLLPAIYGVRNRYRDQVEDGITDEGRNTARYEQFAKIIYDQMKGRSDEDELRYEATVEYANALWRTGKAADAMPMWREAKRLDDLRLDKQKAQIDAQVDDWLRKVDSAAGLDDLTAVAKACVTGFETRKLFHYSDMAGQLKRYYPQAKPEDMRTLGELIQKACSAFRRLAKESLPADAKVVEGLARTHQSAGNYAQAMPLYRTLLAGLTADARNFLAIQADYCTCWLAALKADKEAMRRLVTYIRELAPEKDRKITPELRERFKQILNEAERNSK